MVGCVKLECGGLKIHSRSNTFIYNHIPAVSTVQYTASYTMQAYPPTGAVPIPASAVDKQPDMTSSSPVMLSPPCAITKRSSPLSMSPALSGWKGGLDTTHTHNKVHVRQHVLQDAYTELALSHTAVLHQALVHGVDVPLEDVDDVESLHPLDSLVELAEACTRCVRWGCMRLHE